MPGHVTAMADPRARKANTKQALPNITLAVEEMAEACFLPQESR